MRLLYSGDGQPAWLSSLQLDQQSVFLGKLGSCPATACPTDFPCEDPDMQRFYRVHHSLEQVQPHSDVVFSFILGALNELDDNICVIVVTVKTRESTTTGACMWPKSTSIWRLFDLCLTGRAWSVYHNNQKMNHSNVLVNNGDHFSCYEKLLSHRVCTEPNHGK